MARSIAPHLAIQLLPEWTPSSVDPAVSRLDAVVKVPAESVLEDNQMQLLLLDDEQRVLATKLVALSAERERPAAGPFWTIVRGGLIKMDDRATHACAVLNGVRSAPVARREATVPLLLHAITAQVGAAGEPHLWWRFYNRGDAPIAVHRLFDTTRLELDDRTFSPRPAVYDGPAELPSKRAISGWWSLDEIDPRARVGAHRFRLTILGEASEPLVFEWTDPP